MKCLAANMAGVACRDYSVIKCQKMYVVVRIRKRTAVLFLFCLAAFWGLHT